MAYSQISSYKLMTFCYLAREHFDFPRQAESAETPQLPLSIGIGTGNTSTFPHSPASMGSDPTDASTADALGAEERKAAHGKEHHDADDSRQDHSQ